MNIKNRFGLLIQFILFFVVISNITRLSLFVLSINNIDMQLIEISKIFLYGTFYDLVTSLFIATILWCLIFLIPNKYFNTKITQLIVYTFIFVIIFAMLFNVVSEWLFWDEFGVRYNFIAVDYLVYTKEVIGNIKESYPITLLLSIIFVICTIIFLIAISFHNFDKYFSNQLYFRARLYVTFGLLFVVSLAFYAIPSSFVTSLNQYNNELSKNGIYQLFSAFRQNQLDYDKFYSTLPLNDTLTDIREYIKDNHSMYVDANLSNIQRIVTSTKSQEIRPNIVLVTIESLSAEFLGSFGNNQHLTPNLDSIAKDALLFNNIYATGTRTVRGIEAITLSIPPTPGSSIVKRPNNENLFSIGTVLSQKGYENKFIYGGYGYFDNMNKFFENNHFSTIDRGNFEDNEITFGNVWGLCDEDVFNKSIKEADKSYDMQKPFFHYILTTSNHRPFTYPDNKIDIPSHKGREGGVKYTDYAIGEFIKQAKNKPWFDNTVFVFVADHCASSAGATQLPIEKYKIPLIIYSPHLVQANTVGKMASQIDVAPTLFDLLGWKYESKFYGNSIIEDDFHQRVLISTYQKLGYLIDNTLYVLQPQKKYEQYDVQKKSEFVYEYKQSSDNKYLNDAIATYQSASYLYNNDLLKE